MRCSYCDRLNKEVYEAEITQIKLQWDGWYRFNCPIIYCPSCGRKLKRYPKDDCTEKDELYMLYSNMTDSMRKAVKDIMLTVNGEEID